MLGLRWVEVWHSIRSVGEQTPFPSAIMKRHENQRSIEETNLYISIDISYASSWVFLLLLLRCLSTSAYDARNHTTSNEQTNLKPKKKRVKICKKIQHSFHTTTAATAMMMKTVLEMIGVLGSGIVVARVLRRVVFAIVRSGIVIFSNGQPRPSSSQMHCIGQLGIFKQLPG